MKKSKSELSYAEKNVLRSVSVGKTNKQIASAMGVSESMIKHHVGNILRKLRLKNRVEAVIYGLMITGFRHELILRRRLNLWRKRSMMLRQGRHKTG